MLNSENNHSSPDSDCLIETPGISVVENGRKELIQGIDFLSELKTFRDSQPELSDEEAPDLEPSRDLLAIYMKEASRFKLLTPEEEKDIILASRGSVEKEALAARNKLVSHNLRLVVKIASQFGKYWMRDVMDLVQEGNAGLLHSLKKFDPERGVKLSYYASFWIKAYIMKFMMENWRLVKLGTTQIQRKLFYNLKREKEKLAASGLEVTSELLAEVLDVPEDTVKEMEQRLDSWELSLNAPLNAESTKRHQDYLRDSSPSPAEIVEKRHLLEWLGEHLDNFRQELTRREQNIFDLRILSDDPWTLEAIGELHKVSRERIRQNEEKLIEKFKKFIEEIGPMRKGEGLTGIMVASSAQKLRELGINTVPQLTSLTSDQFIQKFADRKYHMVTVKVVAERMLEHKKYFADGEEATRALLDYDPKTYVSAPKMPPTSPSPAPEPPPPEAAVAPAAKDALSSETQAGASAESSAGSGNDVVSVLRKIADALEILLASGEGPIDMAYFEKITAKDGRRGTVAVNLLYSE